VRCREKQQFSYSTVAAVAVEAANLPHTYTHDSNTFSTQPQELQQMVFDAAALVAQAYTLHSVSH